jgi:Tol biopolymer transport system component
MLPASGCLRVSRVIARATLIVVSTSCAHGPALLAPDERPTLDDLRQLTFRGASDAPDWSPDGQTLVFRARAAEPGAQSDHPKGCGELYRMTLAPGAGLPSPLAPVPRETATVRFFPDGELLHSASPLAGPCADRTASAPALWRLDGAADLFRGKPGAAPIKLTDSPGYDGEAAICARDGSIVFTSVRDGDPELYRIDRDGKNLRRLTRSVGYDGGASFNRDCSRLVWRASRPRPGPEQSEYRALLGKGLVSAARLEIWTASDDGADPHQLTDLDATSFAPVFHPNEDVIVFASNVGEAGDRELDLWAMHGNGTGLRRITHTPGYDGDPRFSPDGRWLSFSSQRALHPRQDDSHFDSHLFIARWKGLPALPESAWRAADRIQNDVAWLADKQREGRGVGTEGLREAGHYLERRLRMLGAVPAGDADGFRQAFTIVTGTSTKPGTSLSLGGQELGQDQFLPMAFSADGEVAAPLVLAGYGIVSPPHHIDDYAGLDLRGKIAVVRRFAPEDDRTRDSIVRRQLGDLRVKARAARERGALALLVVDWPLPPAAAAPDWQPEPEAPLGQTGIVEGDDVGIPVAQVKRAALTGVMPQLIARKPIPARLSIGLVRTIEPAFNVIGRIAAAQQPAAGTIVIGAHYDHLGLGGRFSRAPGRHEPHLGADDNASGTAAALEVARQLAAGRAELKYDVIIALFSGEESGLLGSAFFTRSRPDVVGRTVAMLNLDMVGRMRDDHLDVFGGETALEWPSLLHAACGDLHVTCVQSGDGQGPSDQASFYAAGLPVLHFFTGTHDDYHKPSDTADRIFPTGAATVAELTARVVRALNAGISLSYQKGNSPPPNAGDARALHASLGTIPAESGPPAGRVGVLLSGVRTGSGAEKAGMRRGDILIRLGERELRSVDDLMLALQTAKPGEITRARLVRDGQELEVEATLQESRRGP